MGRDMDSAKKKNHQQQLFIHYVNRGFTLVEVLLVIMLIVIFTVIILPTTNKIVETSKEEKDIMAIENAMKFYKLENGIYPTTAQGISALVTKPAIKPIPPHWIPYLHTVPRDRWGKPYRYVYHQKSGKFEVYSCGPPLEKQDWWFKVTHQIKASRSCNFDANPKKR